MLLFNHKWLTNNLILSVFCLVLTVGNTYRMNGMQDDKENNREQSNNIILIPPVFPNKRTIQYDEESPSKHQKNTKKQSIHASPSGLTPTLRNTNLYSPVGLKTPKKYIDKTPTSAILELFITNFLHYDEQSSLTPLVKFLFSLDGSGKLQRSNAVLDQQRDPHALFPKFLWAEINEELFDDIFKKHDQMIKVQEFQRSLKACETDKERSDIQKNITRQIAEITKQLQNCHHNEDLINQKETREEMLKVIPKKVPVINVFNMVKKYLLERMDKILEVKYRLENCGSACTQNSKQKRCATCSKFNFSSVQKKWIETFLKHLIHLHEEQNKQNKQLGLTYKKITLYLLAFYLDTWKPEIKPRAFRKLFEDYEDNIVQNQDNVDQKSKPDFDLISAVSKCLSLNASGSYCSALLPNTGNQLQLSNTELIENRIQKSPLYYLLCFNTQHQEIIERIENICTGRYEPVDASKNLIMLNQLVSFMIEDYKQCLDIFGQSAQNSASLSKVKYAEYVLTKTFDLIMSYLTQPCQNNGKTHIMLPDCTNVCPYNFKDLIRAALMIKNVLQLHNKFLDDLIIVKNHHVEQVVYELHEAKKVYQLGGGHLDRALPYNINVEEEQHIVQEATQLASNTATGVTFRDWFIYNNQGKYIKHKNATVFPACFNQNFWSQYVLKLHTKNSADRNICLYNSGKRVKEKEGVYKRMVIFQHQHGLGCNNNACTCDQNSIMYIGAIIREEIIDTTIAYDDPTNIVRSLISLYPLSAYCLEYDGSQDCFFLNGKKIEDDTDLNDAIPNYLGKTTTDQVLELDLDGKPVHRCNALSCSTIYEVLLNAREKIHAAHGAPEKSCDIDSTIIEITDPATHVEYVLVKVAQGILVKMLKTDLLKI